MYVNGFIVQKYVANSYKGIDGSGFSDNTGENWYLNNNDIFHEQFEPYYDENIGKTYWDLEPFTWVSACTDIDYINRYINVSKSIGIEYRILLVETEISQPQMNYSGIKKHFLGYDYAYANGDNYSAVYNEIPFIFSKCKLNDNGLFETEKEIHEYILLREEFKKTHKPSTLEEGEFIVFKLYEVEL